MKHEHSLDTLCAALTTAMGIEAPENAAPANEILVDYVNKTLGGEHVDRIFMYNPDAIATWIYQKYPHFFSTLKERTGIDLPLCTVMPSVTPVCFATDHGCHEIDGGCGSHGLAMDEDLNITHFYKVYNPEN